VRDSAGVGPFAKNEARGKMQFVNCAALAVILYITLTANICSSNENLRLCSSAEAGIVLNLFLNFEKNSLVFL